MLVKLLRDHRVKESPTCGELREILTASDYDGVGVALAFDIGPTAGHFHRGFEEIYLVLDGWLKLRLYDPDSDRSWTLELQANELAVIGQNIHHKVTEASPHNRLCVLTVPPFEAADEHLSGKLR